LPKKDFGGLEILDLRSLNLTLLNAWIFKYQLNKNAISHILWISNTELRTQIFSVVGMWELLLSRKE
jgi:hypothetical protein